MNEHKHADKRRVMLTQLLHSPVFNSAGEAMGHLEDLIVKLDGGGNPPVSGIKVRSIGRIGGDVFVNSKSIETLAAGEVRLNTQKMDTTDFQRRPGEVLLAGDVLGRHLMDVTRGRIVQAHDLVLAPSADGWRLMGVDRSPRAMFRRFVPRRGRPDLRRHALLDWKDVQPFVAHVPTAKLLMPLQRLRRLHPAQIADLVEGATHAEGEEILDAVEGDAELTADIFEEMDTEHQVEFLRSLSNSEAARVLERMAPDDAADLFGELDQDRRKSIFDLMSAEAQHKLRKLLQYHPSTAGGMMSPDYISVISGATVGDALEAVRSDVKSPRQLLNTVFVISPDGKLVGSVGTADLLRSEATRKVDELDLVTCRITASADLTDVTLMVADYNLIALAVTDVDGNLVGAVSSDDVIEAIVPEDWRARISTSSSV
ncbi:MAG TPA: CBS domain-containing protein [Candidatus Acidoferrum sp.]|jgi:CBS domain-containing protein|nr:CBS domain-containing protein [Candidatus Acidoferrum sp.]